jgi:TPR repeat protein
MMKIERILFAAILLVAYPAISDTEARAETPLGATKESLQQLYRAANEARNPDVMYLTGLMFDRGESVPRDYQEALRWYVLAAEAGQADATNNLGLMYALGHGVSQDVSEAIKWWIKAVDSGSITAMINIAITYFTAQGVPHNYPEAAKWLVLAAEKGDADAMNMLGLMYAQGLGVTRSRANAIELFERSAYLGCSSAMVNLGSLYATESGVDKRLAYAWVRAALLFGVPAEERDATVYILGTIVARLGSNQLAGAEELARNIVVTIVNREAPKQDRESDQKLSVSMIWNEQP